MKSSIFKAGLFTVTMLLVGFFVGAFGASAAGYDQYAATAGLAVASLNFIPKGNLKTSFNIILAADVVAEWKAVYKAEGQGVKDIMTKLTQRSVTAKYFPTRFTEKTVLEKVSAEFSRVLQRFQKQYTPVGGVKFEPLKIALFKLKIDLQERPDELEESWLGFLADSSLNRKDWPFIKWFLMNALIQAEKDLEMSEIYHGVAGAIVEGTPTAAGASLDGIKVQINRLNTAGKLDLITMGAVPTDPILYVEYIEDMIKQVERPLRNELDYIFVQEDGHDLFRDGMRLKYNVNYAQVDDSKITKLRNDNIQIVGLPSMAGSDKIWTTPSWNRQAGFKKPGNETVFQVENIDRLVKAYTDYYKGFGFWIGEYVVSNDVELV